MPQAAHGDCGLYFDCATTKVLMAKESALKRLRIRKADDSYLSVGVFFLLRSKTAREQEMTDYLDLPSGRKLRARHCRN